MAKATIPLIGLLGDEKYTARFMRKMNKSETSGGCWLWTAGRVKNIDGTFRGCFRGPHNCRSASRMAYALFRGDVPEGALVLHTCDNGMCVNPGHLYLGTHKQNTNDMIQRGRARMHDFTKRVWKRGYKRGWMSRRSKLTDDDVRAIRLDERKPWEIAPQYGISEVHVAAVKKRRRKGHVPDEPA